MDEEVLCATFERKFFSPQKINVLSIAEGRTVVFSPPKWVFGCFRLVSLLHGVGHDSR